MSRRVNGALAAVGIGLVSVAALAGSAAQAQLSKPDADRFLTKITAIEGHAVRRPREPLRTAVSEAEVNAYLAYHARDQIPPGVVSPYITIVGQGGRLSGRAVVDLDGVRRQHQARGWLDPLSYLTGRVPVLASGVLRTSNGVARLDLQSISVGGVPVPKAVLQELLYYYSRTADKPDGINLDDPIALPAGIREIQIHPKQAIIVQ
jgi:hypothetical protein